MADTPRLGSGTRFKKLVTQVAAKGAKDPKAVAASVGRKKFGARPFGRLAAKKQQSE